MIVQRFLSTWQHLSIRARMSIGYAAALCLLLIIYAAFVYMVVRERFSVEMDHRLDQEVEIAERSLAKDATGTLVWRPVLDGVDGYQTLANVLWIDAHRVDGALIHHLAGGYSHGSASELLAFEQRRSGFYSTELPGGIHLRVLQREVNVEGGRAVIRAAFPEGQIEHDLASLLLVLGLGLPLAVGAAGLVGYWLAGRALSPVAKMTREARSITAERLDARLLVTNPNDELGRLAITFNELFSRLGQSFDQLKRFTSDASHELRTPLTVIRSVGEVALRERRDEVAYRDTIGTMLEESDRLTQLVQSLLTLARADSGRIALGREAVDLGRLAWEAVNHLRVLAEEKGQQIEVAVSSLMVLGDPAVLRQAVVNILDNAIKYSPPDRTIRVVAEQRGGEAILEIADSGPGIAVEHRERIFDRFYRVDPARSRETGGFGLGLAIARWAVVVNGGRLEVDSRLGGGSIFRIALPSETVATVSAVFADEPPQ